MFLTNTLAFLSMLVLYLQTLILFSMMQERLSLERAASASVSVWKVTKPNPLFLLVTLFFMRRTPETRPQLPKWCLSISSLMPSSRSPTYTVAELLLLLLFIL